MLSVLVSKILAFPVQRPRSISGSPSMSHLVWDRGRKLSLSGIFSSIANLGLYTTYIDGLHSHFSSIIKDQTKLNLIEVD